VLLLLAGFGLLALAWSPEPTVVAQEEGAIIDNPDLYMPGGRVKEDVLYKVREARQREKEAQALDREGKTKEAFEKWRDAFGRYHHLREEYLKDDMPRNAELLVRAEWFEGVKPDSGVYSETWIPLADYINERLRLPDWPEALKSRLSMQQSAKGAEMLRRALENDDAALLRRCARFYQFSDAGRTALRMLASQSLETADSVSAVRWLEDYRATWPDDFAQDPTLQLLFIRACRDAGMNYRLHRMLRWLDRNSISAEVDVNGKKVKSLEYVHEMAEQAPPVSNLQLTRPGWPTLQGGNDRNAIAPPVAGVSEMLDMGAEDGVQGFKLVEKIPGLEQNPDQYSGEETPPLPVVFPTVHESGFFVHRIAADDNDNEELKWFRHGRESNPLSLVVPKSLRYPQRPQNRNRWWGRATPERDRYRVLSSSIGRLRWELDNRESDVLFTVLGTGNPSREKSGEPSGNQITSFDLGADAKMRVTLPNKKVEANEEWDFLQHVVFSGAPLIRDNKLYIAGAYTGKDTFEVWMFCFDVTPKGDPSKGEGKLLWRTQLCAKKIGGNQWGGWGNMPVELPEISSIAEQGGMLYCSTHTGCTAAVDRKTGELCWVSRYSRERNYIPRGWFPNAPIAAGGFVVTAPYDYKLCLVLDAVTGAHWMEYPKQGKGALGEYEYILGVVDNRLLVQGRSRLYSVGLTSFREGGTKEADWGAINFQAEYGNTSEEPSGRGVIAGNSVLIPFNQHISVYDVDSGKLKTKIKLDNVKSQSVPTTLTVYCRGESYKDQDGITRYKPCTLTDPKTGNVFNVEHLHDGDTFTFPSGEKATVKKETFVIVASAQWVYVFKASDK